MDFILKFVQWVLLVASNKDSHKFIICLRQHDDNPFDLLNDAKLFVIYTPSYHIALRKTLLQPSVVAIKSSLK